MQSTKTILGLIPARGGSKGIPRKNLRLLAGRPLLAWTVAAAQASRCLTRVVLSTDDEEIADLGRRLGVEVPFIRPASLAGDCTSSNSVVEHAIHWFRDHEPPGPDYVMLLQPTSPLCTAADMDAAAELALSTGAPAVVSVSPMSQHPCYARELGPHGELTSYFAVQTVMNGERLDLKRRQDLPPAYAENGAIFLCQTEVFLREKTFFLPGTRGSIMPEERALDIDSPWHFELAELMLSQRSSAQLQNNA